MGLTHNVTSTRRAAVGRSREHDSYAAGFDAASQASNEHGHVDTSSLLIVFAGHQHDHQRLIDGIRSAAGNTALVGCTTGGEIAVGGPSDDGVVVMALGGQGLTFCSRMIEVVDGDLKTASALAAESVSAVDDLGYTVLLLLSDGLSGDQQEVVRGAYSTAGAAIPLVGGCAGDGMQMKSTALFHTNGASDVEIGDNRVVAVAMSSVAPFGIGMHHGWQQVGDEVLVTRSSGNVIAEIDDEPALDRYLRLHGASPSLADDPEAFTTFAAIHPIGISRRGRVEVRFISGADPAARTITSIASVPQGSIAYAMEGSSTSVLDASDIACSDAINQLAGPPTAVLAFDCVARRGVLGDAGVDEEVERIVQGANAPIAGFYTYGEFARLNGASGFHNQTLVTLAIG